MNRSPTIFEQFKHAMKRATVLDLKLDELPEDWACARHLIEVHHGKIVTIVRDYGEHCVCRTNSMLFNLPRCALKEIK